MLEGGDVVIGEQFGQPVAPIEGQDSIECVQRFGAL